MLNIKVLNEVVSFDLEKNSFSTDSETVFKELADTLGESVLTGVGVVNADTYSLFGIFAMCSLVDEEFEIIDSSEDHYLQYRLFTEGDVLTD